jgi:hypothetical protein
MIGTHPAAAGNPEEFCAKQENVRRLAAFML